MRKFFPFLEWMGDVNRQTAKADFLAGLTGAVVVLPQGVAFAMIAGMPPINGLYTAMILPIVAALFGSSRHLISGPTTAISIVVFSAVSPYAVPGTPEFVQIAIVVTLVAGVIQLLLGLARLGNLVNFVSHTVVLGFTAGAALLIGVSQLKHVMGISVTRGASFMQTLSELALQVANTNLAVFGVGISTLIIAILIRKFSVSLPYMLIAMILGSLIAWVIGYDNGITTVGELPSGLPPFGIPNLGVNDLTHLVENSFAIALLGLIEAVAIGRSIATKSGQRINGNQEFIGQGLSNIVGSFFSCYAGSGSFTRSGVNYSAGAQTPLAGIVAALLLVIIVLFVGPLAAYLPISVMGGIILLVAYNLVDFHAISKIIRTSKRETTVLLITFIATLTLELEYAIYLGIIFSLVFYLNRTSQPRFVTLAPDEKERRRMFRNPEKFPHVQVCPQLMVRRIEGSLFFGSVEFVSVKMDELYRRPEKHLLIVANNINLIDISGAEYLVHEIQKWRKKGKEIYICGLKLRAREFLQSGGFWDEIGAAYIFEQKGEAIEKIFARLDKSICANCESRIFHECKNI